MNNLYSHLITPSWPHFSPTKLKSNSWIYLRFEFLSFIVIASICRIPSFFMDLKSLNQKSIILTNRLRTYNLKILPRLLSWNHISGVSWLLFYCDTTNFCLLSSMTIFSWQVLYYRSNLHLQKCRDQLQYLYWLVMLLCRQKYQIPYLGQCPSHYYIKTILLMSLQ